MEKNNEQPHQEEPMLPNSYIEVDGRRIAVGLTAMGLGSTIAMVAAHELVKQGRERQAPDAPSDNS